MAKLSNQTNEWTWVCCYNHKCSTKETSDWRGPTDQGWAAPTSSRAPTGHGGPRGTPSLGQVWTDPSELLWWLKSYCFIFNSECKPVIPQVCRGKMLQRSYESNQQKEFFKCVWFCNRKFFVDKRVTTQLWLLGWHIVGGLGSPLNMVSEGPTPLGTASHSHKIGVMSPLALKKWQELLVSSLVIIIKYHDSIWVTKTETAKR